MIDKSIQRQVSELLRQSGEFLSQGMEAIIEHLRGELPSLKNLSDQDIKDMIAISLNYEEETTDTFTLQDAIVWMKKNFDRTRYSGGCLLRVSSTQMERIERHAEEEARHEAELKTQSVFSLGTSMGKLARKIFFKQPDPNMVCLQLCFLDKEGNPLLSADAKHKVVYCKQIESSLQKQFGNKDMVVFK